MGKLSLLQGLAAIGFVGFSLFLITSINQYDKATASLVIEKDQSLGAFKIVEPTIENGFLLDTFNVVKDKVKEGDLFSTISVAQNISYTKINELVEATKEMHNLALLKTNKPYTFLKKKNSSHADYFIYEPDRYNYLVYDINNPGESYKVKRKVDVIVKEASGVIDGGLWQTLKVNNLNYYDLPLLVENALEGDIDFHHLQKGDKFKLLYEEDWIEGEKIGVGKLHAAYYQNADHEYYAVYFENERHNGFFDLEGRSMKRAFLKSPIKSAHVRISSSFGRRFHPILKKRKMHLGTDYAAPKNTPIQAVADGVITKRTSTRNNGRFVKIKHSSSISTQYLHMNSFDRKAKLGSHVKQGQTIGYVGKTGLATGYHVCFRFWKNGKQVNHRKLNLPPPDPMPKEDLPRFYTVRDSIKSILDGIEYDLTVLPQEIAQRVVTDEEENAEDEGNP